MKLFSSAGRALLTLLGILLLSFGCQQQEKTDESQKQQEEKVTAADTLLDTEKQLRSTTEQVERLGIPSPEEVDSLRKRAHRLYEADSCSKAVKALQTHAKKANWLANVVKKGLDPFYDASYDEQENLGFRRVQELREYERLSNNLKQNRNESYVMIAECERKLGNDNMSAVYYLSALDLIDMENEDLWGRARSGLYENVGVE